MILPGASVAWAWSLAPPPGLSALPPPPGSPRPLQFLHRPLHCLLWQVPCVPKSPLLASGLAQSLWRRLVGEAAWRTHCVWEQGGFQREASRRSRSWAGKGGQKGRV